MPRLLIIFIVGLLCADTDEFAFAIKYMRGYPAPFSVATYGMMADKLYKLGLFLAASGVVAAFFMDAAQTTRRRLIVAGAVAFYVWASARMVLDGYGPMAPFLNEARGFMIFAGALAAGLLLGKNEERLRETTAVFQWMITIKALLVLVLYAFFGGVPLVADIPSVEIDGGFLMLCLVAATMAVWRLLHADRPVEKLLHIASLLLCLAIIIGSYRRLVVIYCGLVFAAWIIPRWIQKKGWIVGGASALAALVVAMTGGFMLYAGWFGWEAAASRAQSLLMSDSVDGQQALSSELYLDDWRVWSDYMRENWLFGLGLRNAVVSHARLTDAVFGGDGSRVSLHAGVYELWMRMGVIGVFFHIVYFALLPISIMRRGAALKSPATRDYVLIACAIIGVFGLFPFSGFNHYMQAFALSAGTLLGVAFALTSQTEPRRPLSVPVRPIRMMPRPTRYPQKHG